MWAGVGKSGSPAPKPMTFSPAALRAFALASMAKVADSATAATRAEMRRLGMRHAVIVTSPSPTSPSDRADIRLPASILPNDGRFGCGPSKIRPEAVAALAAAAPRYLGTSHRQAGVKSVVGRL